MQFKSIHLNLYLFNITDIFIVILTLSLTNVLKLFLKIINIK